jgi:uncharacterized protein (TIGR02118 family)
LIQLTVLYGHPQDTAAFDQYYQHNHAPLAKTIPGLRGYLINKPAALDPQEKSPYYLIATLYFDDTGALLAALGSPEGQAAARDLPNFATGGATLITGEVQVISPTSIS